jgi:hypothetical protein
METREEILKRINWDSTYTVKDYERILAGKNFNDKKFIYHKLLKSARWYNLLQILSKQELQEMLSPEILDRFHIASMKDNYRYARKVLFG